MAQITLVGLVGGSDAIVESFLGQVYPAIAAGVSKPIYYLAILYWVVYFLNVYKGHVGIDLRTLLAKMVLTVGIIAALNWAGFAHQIYKFFTTFMESSAATIMAGKPTATMLDALWSNVGSVSVLMQSAGWSEIGIVFTGYGLFIVNCLLFVVALYYMTFARFGLAITMVLLPMFVGFLFFDQTRQWGMNWISKMLSFCWMYILVIAIVRFGFVAFGDIVVATEAAAGVKDIANITANQVGYLYIIEGVLILFMLNVKSWAAGFAGSVATHGITAVVSTARMLRVGPRGKK